MNTPFIPREVYEHLNLSIIGQDEAKKALSNVLYNGQLRIKAFNHFGYDQLDKMVILLVGDTGTGKSYLIEKASEFTGSVVEVVDCSSLIKKGFTTSGGLNLTDVMTNYLAKCFDKAEEILLKSNDYEEHVNFSDNFKNTIMSGIIFFDEFDKLATCLDHNNDAFGTAVQDNLLKFIEGGVKLTYKGYEIDSKLLPIVLAGAFSSLRETLVKETEVKKEIGFHETLKKKNTEIHITKNDIIKFGMREELMGRINAVVELKKLSKNNLKDILTDTNESLLNQYRSMFGLHGITVNFSTKLINTAVKTSFLSKLGARALKEFFISKIGNTLYNLPEMEEGFITLDLDHNKIVPKKRYEKLC